VKSGLRVNSAPRRRATPWIRSALGERRREHDVLGGGDARLVEQDVGAAEETAAEDELLIDLDARTQRLQPEHVRVDTPATDLIAAGVREARFTLAGQQRTREDETTPNPAQQGGIGSGGRDAAGAKGDRVRVVPLDVHAEPLDQAQHGAHVGDVGQIAQAYRLVGEERRRDQREGGVLVAARTHRPHERRLALDDELSHARAPS
jgi:hypothetical protein